VLQIIYYIHTINEHYHIYHGNITVGTNDPNIGDSQDNTLNKFGIEELYASFEPVLRLLLEGFEIVVIVSVFACFFPFM
jgi:hypothetical protein